MKIRLLILEPETRELQHIIGELNRTGFDLVWECVTKREAFIDTLDRIESGESSFDIALVDQPSIDGDVTWMLTEVKARGLDLPVIVVSASMNEEMVVKLMRLGATDFVCKQRMSRLGPAVVQAINHFGPTEKKWFADVTEASRVTRLASIFDIGRRAASILNLPELLNETVRLIALRLGYAGAAIRMEDGHWAEYPSHASNGNGAAEKRSFESLPDPPGLAAENRSGYSGSIAPVQVLEDQSEIRFGDLAVPLQVRQQIIGVLVLRCRPDNGHEEMDPELLEILADQVAIAIQNTRLFNSLQRVNDQISDAYDATLRGWAYALELRDDETREHTDRVTEMSDRLGVEMGLTEEDRINLRRGALLHDIGKLGVPDRILMKEGELTEEEWALMRRHPEFAERMLSSIHYLQPALEIPVYHHEKWDGTGYPLGLKGDDIPLPARIFAVADVWDALRSRRPYRKEPWPESEAIEYIVSESGKHFDPQVVEVFLKLFEQGVLEAGAEPGD